MSVRIVGLGWESALWSGTFYPDDLPREWRLDYYANEFLGVVVPQGRWMEAQGDELLLWHEESLERFRFYLQLLVDPAIPAEGLLESVTRCANHLQEKFGGVVVSVNAGLGDQWQQALVAVARHWPVGVDWGAGEHLSGPLLDEGIGECWYRDGEVGCRGRGLGAVTLTVPEDERALRRVVEGLMGSKQREALMISAHMPNLIKGKIITDLLIGS